MTTRESWYQKGKTSLDLNEARDDGVSAGLPWGRNFYPHTHPIPIPMGIPMGIPIPTADLGFGMAMASAGPYANNLYLAPDR